MEELKEKKRMLSGIKPSGDLTLGSYLGAIKNWAARSEEYDCFYFMADLHAITVPLSKHTSFRIGGPARRLAFPANREQLVILMGLAESCGVKPFLLGRGTNLLVDARIC